MYNSGQLLGPGSQPELQKQFFLLDFQLLYKIDSLGQILGPGSQPEHQKQLTYNKVLFF